MAGEIVGLNDGSVGGCIEGGSVSCKIGPALGLAVGGSLGLSNNIDVGSALDLAVEGSVGLFDGIDVGVELGSAAGGTMGLFDGIDVGVAIGLKEDSTSGVCKSEGTIRDDGRSICILAKVPSASIFSCVVTAAATILASDVIIHSARSVRRVTADMLTVVEDTTVSSVYKCVQLK